jgi:integrase
LAREEKLAVFPSISTSSHLLLPGMRSEKTVLTPEQSRQLLSEVKEHALECFLTLALTTGMRVGELMALHWTDIDLTQGSLQVRRTVNYIKGHGYVESDPKTSRSRRRIKLPRFAVETLVKQQAQQRAGNEGWIEQGLVFTNALGGHMARTTIRETFNRILKKAGLPHVRFHDLRHSAATILLSWGVHPKVVQEILDHSQISMTLDTYSHVLPSMQDEVTKKWDDWGGGSGAGVPGQ